jgi:hypothetical protein
MNPGPLLFIPRLFGLLVIVLCSCAALAQADPPGRVGRLNHAEGTVTFAPAGDNEWTDAVRNRPLTRGDRLWTDRKSRVEIQIGSSAIRMDGQTHLEIMALDDQAAQLSLTQGTVYVRVRSLPEGENFEIDMPNLAYRAAYPGDYRIDVDPTDGTTRVTIHSGTGSVYGEGGHSLPLGGGQQVTFRARSLAQVTTQESPPQDAFDHWSAERNRREDQSIAARYVPREVVGYQELDAHGQWKKEPTYGAVWFPQGTPANWAPYRHGHWEWITPWGWNWIDDAPWGFAPFHYGRWALIDSRWAWVPGRLGLRPIYAPALVAFVGGTSDGVLARVSSRSGVAWFPLAPGEMWQPGYRASVAYVSNVNRDMVPGASDTTYAYLRRPEALTAISGEEFHRGRPVAASWLRIAADTLTNAGIVPPPPMPERIALGGRDKPAPAKAAQPDVRQVIANAGTRQGDATRRDREAAQRQLVSQPVSQPAAPARGQQQATSAAAINQREAMQRAEQAKLDQQRKIAEQARLNDRAIHTGPARTEVLAQQARPGRRAQRTEALARETTASSEAGRHEQQAKRAELVKHVPSAARTEPTRREQAQHAERNRREQIALRAEQARHEQRSKREQQAKRTELSRREAQARRSEQLRREAQARRDERLQREAHAQRVEQARRTADRDAQALREQRIQREAQARRETDEREQAQREAVQRQQQATAEQWRRDQAWEQQQRERARLRPALRDDSRGRSPEVWQRGIPILNPGPTS